MKSIGSKNETDDQATPGPWSRTKRGGRELFFVFLFTLTTIIAPLLREEFYPFSRIAIFTDKPTVYCDYQVLDGSTPWPG